MLIMQAMVQIEDPELGSLYTWMKCPLHGIQRKQSRVKNSVFVSEFIVMRTALETSQGIIYKLRMMGLNLDSPTYIYGDNMSVIHITSKPEFLLKKNANSVCYHYICEAVASDESRTGHLSTHENPADIATKALPCWGQVGLPGG